MSDIPAETIEGMSMMDHLRELRMRIVRSVLAVGISTLVLLAFYDQLKNLLTRPYTNLCARRPDFGCDGSLFSLGPLDGFTARMRVCLYGGLVLALPIILWQIWRFVVPALSKREKNYAVPFIASSVLLFHLAAIWLTGLLTKHWNFLSRGQVVTSRRRTKLRNT